MSPPDEKGRPDVGGPLQISPAKRITDILPGLHRRCSTCGNPGVRDLGKDGYCGEHLTDLYLTFSVFKDGGVGLPDGQMRPEYGPLIQELLCCRCGATWAGVPGDPCGWCQRSLEIQREHQADLVLQAPDVDPDDVTLNARFEGWRKRLSIAVEAELISATKAENAWRRAVDRLADHAA